MANLSFDLTNAERVWNRAALLAGGLDPREGDRALAALLLAHGAVMNGGVSHSLEVLSVEEQVTAAMGFLFFSFADVADLFAKAAEGTANIDSSDDRYWRLCRTMVSSSLASVIFTRGRRISSLPCDRNAELFAASMSIPDPETLASLLRVALGEERRYRRFVRELESPRSDGLILFWQSAALDRFETERGIVLPRRAEELRTLLPALPTPRVLQVGGVPEWIRIEELGGASPVQGHGTAGAWRWYFRARHESWSLGAVRGPDADAVSVGANSDNAFFVEEEYGELSEDASYMPLDEARYFVVEALTGLKLSRGLLDAL